MNRATRIIVSALGVGFGIAGLDHGFFETLQGYTPTHGMIIQAIGPANLMWIHGTEDAFTLVPNFLITGILAILVSLAIMVWSIGFIHTKHGSSVFLLLFALLFLVGGGIGQIVFFVPTWLFSTLHQQTAYLVAEGPPRKRPAVPGQIMACLAGDRFAAFPGGS